MTTETNLPVPQGWKILIRKDKAKTKSAGGVLLPDSAVDAENYMSITAQVVSMGPLCYHNKDTGVPWPGGRWCKPGDWVIVPKFTQFKMEIGEQEYRFINDDEVIAVVSDPKALKVYT